MGEYISERVSSEMFFEVRPINLTDSIQMGYAARPARSPPVDKMWTIARHLAPRICLTNTVPRTNHTAVQGCPCGLLSRWGVEESKWIESPGPSE